ncbi:MAG: phage portal protein [Rhizobiaceae bacterium]|nr:phage portal protein [Rhizobiaceae bacterium]
MLERMRDRIADGLVGIVNRLSVEPRYVERSRVPYSSRSLAGVAVTPDTAVTVPAVWACLRYLSQTVAVLPWHVMRDTLKGGERAPNNPVDWLLWKRPSPEWSSFQFRETLMHWALRWGNGYAEIERDVYGRPIALWPLHPERVSVCRDPETNEMFYEVRNQYGGKVEIPSRDMFHIRGFGEGVVGLSVIEYAAESIGWARAAILFAAAFYGNGATPTTVVLNKKPLRKEGLDRQKAEFEQLYGGPRKSHRTAFLDNEADIKRVGLNAQETQLLETQQFLVEEICRWFGVPPHKVMHLLRSTYNNIEHQAIEVVVDSISPWAKRFEDEADAKLFGEARWRGLYTKMNMNALLRGDMKARMEFYKGMQFVGAYSPNDILRKEDENTIGEDGDIHVMQEQMSTLEFIREKKQKTEAASAGDEEDDADADEDVDRLEAEMAE